MEINAKKEKSNYNLFQNSAFMIGLAWKEKKKGILLFAVFIALLEVTLSLLGLFVVPTILGAIEQERPLTEFFVTILAFIIPLALVNMAISYCRANNMLRNASIRIVVLHNLLEKLLSTSYSNITKDLLTTKYAQAQETIHNHSSPVEAIWGTLTNILKNSIGFIIYLLVLTVFDPWIIAIILVTTVMSFLISNKINGWEYRHREEKGEAWKKMGYITNSSNDETLAKDVRLFGMASWLEQIYLSGFSLYKGFISRREKVYIWTDITDLIFAFLRNGLAYIYLINLVINGHLSTSSFLLLFTAVGGFTTWVTGILSEFANLHKQSLALSILREFLDFPEDFLFEEGEALSPSPTEKYELELRNVTFRYHDSDVNTLENINLKIQAGEKLAIVGINGAGKTTLIKLLCGFLDPTEGEVLLNGVNIKTYNRNDYYQLFSAVFQDFSIIAGSIAQNVAQSVTDIDMEKVEDYLKKAGIDDKIKTFPDGYETKLNKTVYDEAVELSGGQTQRLMLARALYKDGPILVLDEPTAALDPIAESEIYQAYNDLTTGKTAIYISHRLASTGFCDQIILLDGKQIAEVGTHESLIKANGKYAQMFDIQSKYYQDEIEDEVMTNE